MNFLFSKNETRTSKEQLDIDFGLNFQSRLNTDLKFTIKPIKSWTRLITNYFTALDFLFKKHSTFFLEKTKDENKDIADLINLIANLDENFGKKLGNIYFFFKRFIFIPWISYLLFKRKLLDYKIKKKDKNLLTHGYFLPTERYSNYIFISSSEKYEITISHEHIHFLQFQEKNKYKNYFQLNLDCIFDIEEKQNTFLAYLSKRIEVEARFHEIVIAHYRKFNKLPLEMIDFFKLIRSLPKEIFLDTHAVLDFYGEEFKNTSEELVIRDTKSAEHLDFIILMCKDYEASYKFIKEVLPCIYSNLLFYYGLEKESDYFSKQIKRPNLYDELYGSHVERRC